MPITNKPILLLILDGWGCSEHTDFNAILSANKPNWDRLWQHNPHTRISASGTEVGLPSTQMGNSEVGHLNLGSGRVVYQEFTRVSRSIKTGSFFTNETLTHAVDMAVSTDKAVHILGLLSPGGVHSHEKQIHAMVELAAQRGAKKIYLHAFLDGRDTPPKSATSSLRAMEDKFAQLGVGCFASVIGRFYAMDRDHRWPRIKAAYDLITQGIAPFSASEPLRALESAYERGESDEFVKATAIFPNGKEPVCINDGDTMVFMNYRSDRARQITKPFIEADFSGFEREVTPKLGEFVTLTEYSNEFPLKVAFPPDRLNNVFGEYISKSGLRQLRIAETEKYAHVTFFFNGGEERPFEGEERILVPSPNVDTYDLQPEMSAYEMTDELVKAIHGGTFDVIIGNYANADMVGHSGNFDAAVKAIEVLDDCLGKVITALDEVGGEAVITADHGNAEKMQSYEDDQPHTAHTTNWVPFIYHGRPAQVSEGGILADVAPSLLTLMGLPQPSEMTGKSIIELI